MATNNSKYVIYNPINIPDTTQSTSLTTGSFLTAGGQAVSGNLYVGGNINVATLNVSESIATDSSKNLISIPHTGTGNNVRSISPSLSTSILLSGSTSGTITIQPQTSFTSYNYNLPITPGSVGQFLTSGGGSSSPMTWTTGGGGTVTSVSASVPAFLSISGSPITTSGTLAISLSGTALPVLNGGTGTTTNTGSGSVVLNDSPSLVTPIIGAATGTSLNLSSLTATQAVATDASKNLISVATTGTGNYVLNDSPSLVTPIIGAATGTSLNLSGLTATQAVATDASKNLISVATTGTGSFVLNDSPTFSGTVIASAATYSGILTANGTIAMGDSKITGLASPTVSTDAANKSYVDNGNPQTTTGTQSVTANVTGLVFTSGHFEVAIEAHIVATTNLSELFLLRGILSGNSGTGWNMSYTAIAGDNSIVSFSINGTGQIQYTSSSYTGFSSLTFIWKQK
jgi:hypothetical protein